MKHDHGSGIQVITKLLVFVLTSLNYFGVTFAVICFLFHHASVRNNEYKMAVCATMSTNGHVRKNKYKWSCVQQRVQMAVCATMSTNGHVRNNEYKWPCVQQ